MEKLRHSTTFSALGNYFDFLRTIYTYKILINMLLTLDFEVGGVMYSIILQ